MIRLCEEMQTEKPTMLNCSKDAHIIFEVFSFNIWVRHCSTLLFQRVPTNDRGWVEFNNGANLGIRITKGTLERNRYHNSLVV
jgi:hypothetical protein